MARRIPAREVPRLRSSNLSLNAIAAALHASKASVSVVLRAAAEHDVAWEEAERMSAGEVYARLFPEREQPGPVYPDPDWDAVHAELAKVGVTLRLLHGEYREECAARGEAATSYDRFCKRYRQFTVSRNVVSWVGRKAGRNMEVDWSGPTMSLVDPATGVVSKVYLFVACLPFSRYSYVEPAHDMKQDTWLRCHVHAFEFLGGATPCIAPDNLKTGVTAPRGRARSCSTPRTRTSPPTTGRRSCRRGSAGPATRRPGVVDLLGQPLVYNQQLAAWLATKLPDYYEIIRTCCGEKDHN